MNRATAAAATAVALAVAAAPAGATDVSIIPLPLYATLPNEGSTYGAMPVFLGVDPSNQRTRWIVAPSASWNEVVSVTGTFRGYAYPSPTRSLTVIAAASARTNRSFTFELADSTRTRGAWTTSFVVMGKQNIFYRFFGIGPTTRREDESSYTRRFGRLSLRQGRNLLDGLNFAVVAELRADDPLRRGVPNLPLAVDAFPDVPGMRGASIATAGFSLAYDTREGGEYAPSGVASEITTTASHALSDSEAFVRVAWQARALVPERRWLQGAVRLSIERVIGGDRVPFEYQSTLGGELLLRGFTEGRFVDRGAWTLDVEQRVRVWQLNLLGVTSDWRIDAFATLGQVFDAPEDAWARVRRGVGLGFRTFVRPNVLGRVDVAYAGEGVNAYVVLGYPF